MTTTETLFQGHLRILQNKKGYRFSIDAAILAHGVSLEKASTAVDLGTGCGVIALILAHRYPLVQIYGIEIQEDLADLADKNVRLNNMTHRVTIVHGDMRDATTFIGSEGTDVVFSNPPYRKVQSGRVCPNGERATARHEIAASLADVLSAAERLLRPSGRFFLIYPATRTAELVVQMCAFKLEPKRLQMIHPKAGSPAELVLVEGMKHGRPGVRVVPPLVIHNADGSFTEEVKGMVEG